MVKTLQARNVKALKEGEVVLSTKMGFDAAKVELERFEAYGTPVELRKGKKEIKVEDELVERKVYHVVSLEKEEKTFEPSPYG